MKNEQKMKVNCQLGDGLITLIVGDFKIVASMNCDPVEMLDSNQAQDDFQEHLDLAYEIVRKFNKEEK